MGRAFLTVLSVLAAFVLAWVSACGDDDDDNNDDSSPAGEDDDNDDTSPTADDDNDVSDDDVDDDSVDDDDASPNGDDDDVVLDDRFVLIAGGNVAATDTAAADGRDGVVYLAAIRSYQLMLYTIAGEAITAETLATGAADPKIAVDGSGALHVVYRNSKATRLVYLTNRTGAWVQETVESSDYVSGADLALGPDDAPHLCYNREENGLVYAVRSATGWSSEIVYQKALSDCAIAVGEEGYVHLFGATVTDSYQPIAVYVTNWSGSWENYRIMQLANGGLVSGGFNCFDVAVDAEGIAHFALVHWTYILEATDYFVSYMTFENSMLKKWSNPTGSGITKITLLLDDDEGAHLFYGSPNLHEWTNAGGSWADTTLEPSGRYASAAQDASGDFLIGYLDANTMDLNLGRESGAAWTKQLVADGTQVGWSVSQALDGDGNVFLAYVDNIDAKYRLAYHSNGAWHFEDIAPGSEDFDEDDAYILIALTPASEPHVMFQELATNDIFYGVREDKGWIVEALVEEDATLDDFAVDKDGYDHLLYNISDEIHYATNRSGDWLTETLTTEAYGIRLAVDANGMAHVVYITNIDWKVQVYYTTNASGTWVEENPYTSDSAWVYSLVLDADDAPHIALGTQEVSGGFNRIRHLWRADGDWKSELAFSVVNDDNDKAIGSGAMAVDADGALHISFCFSCWQDPEIWYATNRSGAWSAEKQFPYPAGADDDISNDIDLFQAARADLLFEINGELWQETIALEK